MYKIKRERNCKENNRNINVMDGIYYPITVVANIILMIWVPSHNIAKQSYFVIEHNNDYIIVENNCSLTPNKKTRMLTVYNTSK